MDRKKAKMNYTTNKILDNDTLRHFAPSVFAETPWQNMSAKYSFVPTIHIVEGMRKEGFNVVSARQSNTRIDGKGDFTKHMLRFRQSTAQLQVGDIFPEIVLINSHDGTSAYTLSSGLFRLACSNGMVCQVGGSTSAYKTRHSGNIQHEVIEASYKIVDEFPRILDQTQEWRGKSITPQQQLAYAESAALLRWEEDQAKPEPASLLTVRRYQDRAEEHSLWGSMNRVQESLIRGGNRYIQRDEHNRPTRRRSRAITGIDQDVKLNKALWALTEKMASLL